MINSDNIATHRGFWDKIWERRSAFADVINGGRDIYSVFFRRFLYRYIGPDTSFLELGCGTSTLALSLAPRMKELVGLDISPAALELSRGHAQRLGVTNARFVEGDCMNVPFSDQFDVVWSQGLMEHFDDPARVASEHLKAAKKGGVALISVPYRYSYFRLWYALTRPNILRPLWPWTEQTFFSKKQVLAVGRQVDPNATAHILQPFFLGIVILELRK
jgi:SAM-dependent methyltransferase